VMGRGSNPFVILPVAGIIAQIGGDGIDSSRVFRTTADGGSRTRDEYVSVRLPGATSPRIRLPW